MTTLKSLLETARAATPGEWFVRRGDIMDQKGVRVADVSIARKGSDEFDANCAFIATFNPSRIIALLEAVEGAERAMEPFAALPLKPEARDEQPVLEGGDKVHPVFRWTAGDFRKLSAALSRLKKATGNEDGR